MSLVLTERFSSSCHQEGRIGPRVRHAEQFGKVSVYLFGIQKVNLVTAERIKSRAPRRWPVVPTRAEGWAC
eukprot:1366789-Amorphochlora_amoeboformis.AAC.3